MKDFDLTDDESSILTAFLGHAYDLGHNSANDGLPYDPLGDANELLEKLLEDGSVAAVIQVLEQAQWRPVADTPPVGGMILVCCEGNKDNNVYLAISVVGSIKTSPGVECITHWRRIPDAYRQLHNETQVPELPDNE